MPTLTVNLTTQQLNRLQYAVGKMQGLMTSPATPEEGPPVRRDATAQEVRDFVVAYMRGTVTSVENEEARSAAIQAVVASTFDPT